MTSQTKLKNRLIDRILVTNNTELLQAVETIFSSTGSQEKLSLNSYQIEMLKMSDKDIENGDLISESELEREDAEWMD
jgi:dihydrofolate reductase